MNYSKVISASMNDQLHAFLPLVEDIAPFLFCDRCKKAINFSFDFRFPFKFLASQILLELQEEPKIT